MPNFVFWHVLNTKFRILCLYDAVLIILECFDW
uniref:Uncharacterized protein n=1 Tax=Anguilla anguilla TaxID=7936 RepID=A0A0E9VGB5_ANGAN